MFVCHQTTAMPKLFRSASEPPASQSLNYGQCNKSQCRQGSAAARRIAGLAGCACWTAVRGRKARRIEQTAQRSEDEQLLAGGGMADQHAAGLRIRVDRFHGGELTYRLYE